MSDLIERVKEIKRNIDNLKDRVDRFKQFYEDYQKIKKLRIKIYKNRERNFKKSNNLYAASREFGADEDPEE